MTGTGDDRVIRVDFGHDVATCPVCAHIATKARRLQLADRPLRVLWVQGQDRRATPAELEDYDRRLRAAFERIRRDGPLPGGRVSTWRRIGRWLARAWRWIRS